MKDQAIEKLRDEMAKEANTPYVGEVGEYLCDYIKAHPRAAAAIMADGKTIASAIEHMHGIAAKRVKTKSAGSAMVLIGPEEGFKIIREYFGIDGATPEKPKLSVIGKTLDDLLED